MGVAYYPSSLILVSHDCSYDLHFLPQPPPSLPRAYYVSVLKQSFTIYLIFVLNHFLQLSCQTNSLAFLSPSTLIRQQGRAEDLVLGGRQKGDDAPLVRNFGP